jgi:hypothetical protein
MGSFRLFSQVTQSVDVGGQPERIADALVVEELEIDS